MFITKNPACLRRGRFSLSPKGIRPYGQYSAVSSLGEKKPATYLFREPAVTGRSSVAVLFNFIKKSIKVNSGIESGGLDFTFWIDLS